MALMRQSSPRLCDHQSSSMLETMSETDIHFYQPATGHNLPHDPFKAIIAPHPIAWISTISAEGVPNLAPYSFFNAIGDNPPIIAFSSSGRKDSLVNAEATGDGVHEGSLPITLKVINLSPTG